MNYTKEKCPVCGKEFTETDDIAVCPVCGTPHHRSCFLEQKNCSNEYRHAEGFEWTPSDEPQLPFVNRVPSSAPEMNQPNFQQQNGETKYCPYCGRLNSINEPVCISCGARLYNSEFNGAQQSYQQPYATANPNVVQIQPNDIIGGHTVADTADFVQRNADKYIPKFYKSERTGKKISFNWAAFLFGPYWFFYRKLYSIGTVILALLLLVSAFAYTPAVREAEDRVTYNFEQAARAEDIETQMKLMNEGYTAMFEMYAMPENVIKSLVSVIIYILSGLFANYLYKEDVRKKLNALKEESFGNTEQYKAAVFRRGGVSLMAVLLAIVVNSMAAQILTSFLK